MTIGEERSFLDQLMDLYRAADPSATDDSLGTLMVRCVQEIYRAIALRDYAGAAARMSEDFVMEILGPPEIPFTGYWEGREQMAAVLERNFSQLDDQTPQLIGVSAHRDAVLVMGRETGRVRSTGKPYALHWVQWFTFREFELCRFLQIFDSDGLTDAFVVSPTAET